MKQKRTTKRRRSSCERRRTSVAARAVHRPATRAHSAFPTMTTMETWRVMMMMTTQAWAMPMRPRSMRTMKTKSYQRHTHTRQTLRRRRPQWPPPQPPPRQNCCFDRRTDYWRSLDARPKWQWRRDAAVHWVAAASATVRDDAHRRRAATRTTRRKTKTKRRRRTGAHCSSTGE